jgi:D-inositol-3-phosphate glycosyltransferase
MKKRIACLTEYTSLLDHQGNRNETGQHAYVSEMITQLAENGWQVDVFTCMIDPAQPKITQVNAKVRVIQIRANAAQPRVKEPDHKFIDIYCTEIEDFVSKEKVIYNLIHANYYTVGLVAIELKRKLKVPIVFTFHELGQVRMKNLQVEVISEARIKIEQQIIKKADAIVVECPQDKADLIQYYKASSKKTFIIPYGFNPNRFFPIDRAEARIILNLNVGDKILLQMGCIAPHRGIDNVIKSMALLDAGKQNIRLIVLDALNDSEDPINTDELKRLKLLAEDLGLASQVSFDERPDVAKLQYYYAAADLFVNTPLFDGLGITPLEAMACGTPVIGSEVGAIKFAVVDGKTGFIIPPKAPELLADRIKLVIKNKALLEQMSRDSVRHVYSTFTWKKVAEQMIDIYEYVLLTKGLKNQFTKAASNKNIDRSIPLRNIYLKRNMQAKYES